MKGRISLTNNDSQHSAVLGISDDAGEREVQFFPKGRPVQAWQYEIVECVTGR